MQPDNKNSSDEFISQFTRLALAKKAYVDAQKLLASFEAERKLQVKIAVIGLLLPVIFFSSTIVYVGCVMPWAHYVRSYKLPVTYLPKNSCLNNVGYFYEDFYLNGKTISLSLSCAAHHGIGNIVTIGEYQWKNGVTTYKETESICLLKP